MGERDDGATGADSNPDGSDSSGQRGLLGRLLSAFSSAESAGERSDEPVQPGGTPAPLPLPGIGNLKLRVDDVAIPKAEIVAVPVTIALDDLIGQFRDHGFSRLPVYDGSLDTPVGLVHLKDLALQQAFAETKPKYQLRKMLRPLLFVPPSMTVGTLLQKMQAERIHMALIIDEYGGVDGLVTLEDLVEQVIGDIDDEHDEAEGPDWALEKPGQYLVQARAPLDEFEAEIGMKLAGEDEDDEVDTLGGLVFRLSGSVPVKGAIISHESGAEFEVVDADPRRLKTLRVRLPALSE